MRKHIASLVVALFLVVAGVATAEAQQSTTATAQINIPTVLFMDVTGTTINFDDPTASDFENGVIAANNSSTIDTKGNVAHDVTVQAEADNFTGGSGTKPATDLVWSTSGAISAPGDGTSVPQSSGSPVDVATALSQGNPAAITVDYGILLDYSTDDPATYTLDFTYTVVAN